MTYNTQPEDWFALSELGLDLNSVTSIMAGSFENISILTESPLPNASRLLKWHSVANALCSVPSLNSNISTNILKKKLYLKSRVKY